MTMNNPNTSFNFKNTEMNNMSLRSKSPMMNNINNEKSVDF
jgi:hypothetical protein